jgi:hypothetical protein
MATRVSITCGEVKQMRNKSAKSGDAEFLAKSLFKLKITVVSPLDFLPHICSSAANQDPTFTTLLRNGILHQCIREWSEK